MRPGSASCEVSRHWLASVAPWRGCACYGTLPNYRVSLSTKIVEYCALGVPVITTPLPLATDPGRIGERRLCRAMGRSERCG